LRVGLIVTGGVDRSGRERVIPALLAFIEAMARRHETHVFALRHYRDPCSYDLLGAVVHDSSTRRAGRRVVSRRSLLKHERVSVRNGPSDRPAFSRPCTTAHGARP